MKIYEKPKLMVLSISANDALCGTCFTAARFSTEDQTFLDLYYGDGDGTLTDSELTTMFADTDNACTKKVNYEGYCKFTGTNQLFSS